jgi:hypothetical protein
MPGFVLHVGAVVQCSHAGQAMPMQPSANVTVLGQPVVTLASPYTIAGCPLTPPGPPPCLTAQWLVGATRVTSNGQPLLIMGGEALSSPTPGPLIVVSSQTRVTAT